MIVSELERLKTLAGRRKNYAAIMFIAPEGAATYTDGDVVQQPRRMRLLGKRLRLVRDTRIPKEEFITSAERVEAAAVPLQSALDQVADPKAERPLLVKVQVGIAKLVRQELMSLKNGWKSDYTEAEIHEIIESVPDAKTPDPKKPPDAKPPNDEPVPQ